MQAGSDSARAIIDDFSIDPGDYREATSAERERMGLAPDSVGDLQVFVSDPLGALALQVHNHGQGNRIFLRRGVSGRVSVGFSGSRSTLFLGRDSRFADQHMGSRQDGDLIAVGNDVSVTGPGRWVSGLRAGDAQPALMIGDACVLSRDVVLRNTDGHPIMDPALQEQTNTAQAGLIIEPHCWLGERAAILKGVTVGAFSIVGFGAVLTRSVGRHCSATGNPATARPNEHGIWCWDDSETGLARARHYLQRYPYRPEQEDCQG